MHNPLLLGIIKSNSKRGLYLHHGKKYQKNRRYVAECLAISQNGALRWLDPAIFLFLYAPYQQCGTIWKLYASWREKVAYCEDVYKRLGSPAIFKISPLVSPDFDYTLENRGYEVQHVTEVMTLHLSDARLDAPYSAVTITDEIPDIWITSLFDLKEMTNQIGRAHV